MYAVMFHSTRALAHDDVYDAWSQRMESAVTGVDGYLSHVGYRDPNTLKGVTISYFESLEAIRQWREFDAHIEAQILGRDSFYTEYTVEVAHIERRYSWTRPE